MKEIRKVCLRCKQNKLLNVGNFKKREAYLDFKPSFDRICRQCKQSEYNKKKKVRKYKTKAREEITCALFSCDNEFMPTRVDQKYCCRDCMLVSNGNKRKDRIKLDKDLEKVQTKNKILNKFLVRGKIYGVDYN